MSVNYHSKTQIRLPLNIGQRKKPKKTVKRSLDWILQHQRTLERLTGEMAMTCDISKEGEEIKVCILYDVES